MERIAKHLHYEKGRDIGHAIASAVNTVKKWCSTGRNHNGGKLKPATKAKACAAVASWEKKKAKGKLKESVEMREALELIEAQTQELTEAEVAELAGQIQQRLLVAEGMLPALRETSNRGKGEIVDRARELLEADLATTVTIGFIGGRHASPREQRVVREALEAEVGDLRMLAESLGVELGEADSKADNPEATTAYERAKRREKKLKEGGKKPAVDRPDSLTAWSGKNEGKTPPTPSGGSSGSEDGSDGSSEHDESKHPRAPKGAPTGGQFVQKGDSGVAVTGAQSALGIETTGNYDRATADAVSAYQEEHGLQVDGVIGSQTAAAMQGREAEVGELSKSDRRWLRKQGRRLTEALQVGTKGELVKELQEGLLAEGIYIGEAGADGRFEADTERGVKAMQRRKGMSPDGVATPEFRADLRETTTRQEVPSWGSLSEAKVRKLGRLANLPDLDLDGPRGRPNIEIKRLPNGQFAPKGMGRVLHAGDNVNLGGKQGKVDADGKTIKLADGKKLDLAPEARGPETQKPTVDAPDTQAAEIADKLEGDNARFQADLDRWNAEQENPDAAVPPAKLKAGQGMASPEKLTREQREAKAKAAHPEGSMVTTEVHRIGGKSDTVTGEVVGHKRGNLQVKTEAHGTLSVSLDKVLPSDGGMASPDGAEIDEGIEGVLQGWEDEAQLGKYKVTRGNNRFTVKVSADDEPTIEMSDVRAAKHLRNGLGVKGDSEIYPPEGIDLDTRARRLDGGMASPDSGEPWYPDHDGKNFAMIDSEGNPDPEGNEGIRADIDELTAGGPVTMADFQQWSYPWDTEVREQAFHYMAERGLISDIKTSDSVTYPERWPDPLPEGTPSDGTILPKPKKRRPTGMASPEGWTPETDEEGPEIGKIKQDLAKLYAEVEANIPGGYGAPKDLTRENADQAKIDRLYAAYDKRRDDLETARKAKGMASPGGADDLADELDREYLETLPEGVEMVDDERLLIKRGDHYQLRWDSDKEWSNRSGSDERNSLEDTWDDSDEEVIASGDIDTFLKQMQPGDQAPTGEGTIAQQIRELVDGGSPADRLEQITSDFGDWGADRGGMASPGRPERIDHARYEHRNGHAFDDEDNLRVDHYATYKRSGDDRNWEVVGEMEDGRVDVQTADGDYEQDVTPEDFVERFTPETELRPADKLDAVSTITGTDEFGKTYRRPLTPGDYEGMADGMIVDGQQIVIPPRNNGMRSPGGEVPEPNPERASALADLPERSDAEEAELASAEAFPESITGMASPGVEPNTEPLAGHYQPNNTALEMEQLPMGTYIADAAGYPYVLHKPAPGKDGKVSWFIVKPVDAEGNIITEDPHPHAAKGVGPGSHGPTRRILFHRFPPASVGAVHPDYAEDVDITVDGKPPVAAAAEKAMEAGASAEEAITQATETIDYGLKAFENGSPVRSAKGNLRNVKAMGNAKFLPLYEQMQSMEDVDAEGLKAVNAEYGRRQSLPSSDAKSLAGAAAPAAKPTVDAPESAPEAPEAPPVVKDTGSGEGSLYDALKASVDDLPESEPEVPSSAEKAFQAQHAASMEGQGYPLSDSPARSAKGNLRNFKAMNDEKLWRLASDMTDAVDDSTSWEELDAEAFDAVTKELQDRGYDPDYNALASKTPPAKGTDANPGSPPSSEFTVPPKLGAVAKEIGGDWGARDVQAALDDLRDKGVDIDIDAEDPAVIAAVVKATGATPSPSAGMASPGSSWSSRPHEDELPEDIVERLEKAGDATLKVQLQHTNPNSEKAKLIRNELWSRGFDEYKPSGMASPGGGMASPGGDFDPKAYAHTVKPQDVPALRDRLENWDDAQWPAHEKDNLRAVLDEIDKREPQFGGKGMASPDGGPALADQIVHGDWALLDETSDARTFDEAGLLGGGRGLVITGVDGSEHQLSFSSSTDESEIELEDKLQQVLVGQEDIDDLIDAYDMRTFDEAGLMTYDEGVVFKSRADGSEVQVAIRRSRNPDPDPSLNPTGSKETFGPGMASPGDYIPPVDSKPSDILAPDEVATLVKAADDNMLAVGDDIEADDMPEPGRLQRLADVISRTDDTQAAAIAEKLRSWDTKLWDPDMMTRDELLKALGLENSDLSDSELADMLTGKREGRS